MNTDTMPYRLLIVDDSASARNSVIALLETLPPTVPPLEIHEAVDGRQAVALAEEIDPQVILMDVQMPRMDGIEATRLIKTRRPTIRVIVLTMYAGNQEMALSAGADVFLLKGCTPETLFAALALPT
ncbi:MAG: response regulator transcription factor [Caldilineaceae bacterium]|nr:response regulator transcription factor [Caldilineaceae bacterium]